MYEPESTELDNELFEEIKNLLTFYATEFDLSLIDESTNEDVLGMIDNYLS